jgi:NAD(P) transhydrogenase subunit alpha
VTETLLGAYVFILAIIVGFEVIARVPSMLHTPLMSGTNAIHGVVLVGAIVVTADAHTVITDILGFIAVVLGSLNVFGGFVVTDRMLQMFRSKPGGARQ